MLAKDHLEAMNLLGKGEEEIRVLNLQNGTLRDALLKIRWLLCQHWSGNAKWREGQERTWMGQADKVAEVALGRDALKPNDFEPLNPPMTDRWGFEHDMKVGPCSCGAFHAKEDGPLKP